MSAVRDRRCVLFPGHERPATALCSRDDCAGCTVRRLEELVAEAHRELVVTAGFVRVQAGELSAAGQVHSHVLESFRAIERDATTAADRLVVHVRAATPEEAPA